MKVCVYGCGAIGSLLAARLANCGVQVSVLARGAHLNAIQTSGLTLLPLNGDNPLNAAVSASDNPADIGVQDVVFLTMKSHSVPAIANAITPLLGADTVVVTASNGIPWWYFYGLTYDFGSPELVSVDPEKKLWQAIGPERALGCVVYPAATLESPGVVRHVFGERFTLGEPDGSDSARLAVVAELLQAADFDISKSREIRADLWTKLVANAAFNPVSVITGKTLGGMLDEAATYSLLEQIMEEVVSVALALNTEVLMSPAELLAATRQLGEHQTSMLQDFEAGRQLELGPVVAAVLELAELSGVEVPSLNMVYQLVVSKINSSLK